MSNSKSVRVIEVGEWGCLITLLMNFDQGLRPEFSEELSFLSFDDLSS